MTIQLLAEGPLSAGRPLALRPPKLSAVVLGEGIIFTEGQYSEPVSLSWRLHRDGIFVGDEGYVPVSSDLERRFILVETAVGSRGITQQVTDQVGTDVPITIISSATLKAIFEGDTVQEVVDARGVYQHPLGIISRQLIFFVDGAEVPAGYIVQGGQEIEVFERVESNTGVSRTFSAGSQTVEESVSSIVTYLGEPVRYLGSPITYTGS
jgi:hypothetical protein